MSERTPSAAIAVGAMTPADVAIAAAVARRQQRRTLCMRIAGMATGVAAAGLGMLAAAAMLGLVADLERPHGLLLHLGAVLLAAAAATLGGVARGPVLDLVVVTAAAVPGFGPALAWTIAAGRRCEAVANAHAAFRAVETAAVRKPRIELAKELRVQSHVQVLRMGSLEEKRNLLRRMARLGTVKYLTVVRQFLRDPEPELRLCAYAEIAHVCEEYEGELADRRRQAEAATAAGDRAGAAAAWAELAGRSRRYASCGALEAEMSRYWLQQATRHAETALTHDTACAAARSQLALALADLDQVEAAWQCIEQRPAEPFDGEYELARAQVAFRRRDHATCAAVAARLAGAGIAVPPWLAAVTVPARADATLAEATR